MRFIFGKMCISVFAALFSLVANEALCQPAPPAQSAALKAIIERIPRANRPIDMAYRSEWDSVSMSMSFVPWVLFSGGIAVEADCKTWNYNFTPALGTTSKAAIGCPYAQWRKVGDSIKFDSDDPVDHGDANSPSRFAGFAPGQRIAISMHRQSGGSVSGGFNSSTSVVSSGELKMSMTGQISVGSWTGVSTQGSNFGAYSNGSRAVRGTYYLDGFLIAIQDEAGRPSLGFIARKTEGRDRFMIVSGDLYWE
jgi:hypothetical protein